jgi:hypothetical protein
MFTPSDLPDPVNATIYQVDRPESDALLLSQALKDWQNDVHSVNQLLNSAMCQIAVPLSSLDIFWVSDCCCTVNEILRIKHHMNCAVTCMA